MIDPKEKPKACETCEKENCPLYEIDEITGQEICWEYTAEEKEED